MAITIGSLTFTKDRTQADNIRYVSGNHTFSLNDMLSLSRTYPKATADFAGNARPAVKMTRDILVGTEKKTMIYNGALQLPVGVAAGDITAFVAQVAAFYATSAATDLTQKLDIEN